MMCVRILILLVLSDNIICPALREIFFFLIIVGAEAPIAHIRTRPLRSIYYARKMPALNGQWFHI